jgi:hypothetical protein
MEDRPWTKYWIAKFQKDSTYGNMRFKMLETLKTKYPPFEIDNTIIDKVDLSTFIKDDDNRIPFFIGSQFGLSPGHPLSYFHKTENVRIIAILGKSFLSGCVFGITLYKIEKNDGELQMNKFLVFENREQE